MVDQQLIKETGATFTPPELADFISNRIISHIDHKEKNLKILDPSCGDGALLISISKELSTHKWNYELTGFDLNEDFLATANENLVSTPRTINIDLIKGDFLEQICFKKQTLSLFDSINYDQRNKINESFDLVIANPPYVRTQVLGTSYAQEIAKKFNLKGRIDLYQAFLIAMTHALKEGGILGVITSNRYLSTKSGSSVRQFLSENFEIIEIIDLGDTKLFDAAVLPAIFVGRKKAYKKEKETNPKFIKIYEDQNDFAGTINSTSSVISVLNQKTDGYYSVKGKTYKKTSGNILINSQKESTWSLLTTKEKEWIDQIQKASYTSIGKLFKVRVGIKTTADQVFIRDNWEEITDSPEPSLLRDLISQENIEAWGSSFNSSLQVLYPHYSKDGKRAVVDIVKYPNAQKYLSQHKEKLSSRKYLIEANREWYELWVPQNPKLWDMPKLVFPDISLTPRFYFDESRKIVNGNCYWIVAQKKSEIDALLLIQGVCNSLLMTKYHDLLFNNKLYSGRRRYFTQFVEKYPLPHLSDPSALEIISLVKKLNHTNKQAQSNELSIQLEHAVAKAFSVSPVLSLH